MMNRNIELAKELKEYTKVIGSHNLHIQGVASELVSSLEQPELNQNQKIALEWLKEEYSLKRNSGWSVLDVVSSIALEYERIGTTVNEPDYLKSYGELFPTEQFQLLAEFAKWGLGEVE